MRRFFESLRTQFRQRRLLIGLCAGSALVLPLACANDGGRPDGKGWGSGSVAVGPCDPGTQRECGVVLEQGEGIVTCYRGTQYCEEGIWGSCTDGDVTTEPDRTWRKNLRTYETQALSTETPQDCMEACDPSCLEFVELPPGFGGGMMGTGGTPNLPGDSPCAHGLCEEGGTLDPTCDPCVNTVCASDPTCCSGAWDGTCVELVYTLCANQPPPLNLCDFGLFARTTVTTGNRPSSGAAIGANGDVVIGTDASPSMIVAGGNLTIMSPNGASVDTPGGVWAGGNIYVQAGTSTTYNGNWNAGGEIFLNGGNTINGDVWAGANSGENIDGQLSAQINGDVHAGGVVTADVQAGVTGTVTEGSTHDPPQIDIPSSIPTRAASCPGTNGNVTLNGGGFQALGPGDYGSWTMNNGNNVISLSPGTYTLNQLTAAGANSGTPNVIRLDGTTTDRWDITVCSDSSVQNWFEIQDSSGARLTNPVQLVMYFDRNLSAGTDSYFAGVFMVPNGSFTSSNRTQINGAIWSHSIDAGTDLNAVPMDKAACEALGIVPGVTINQCPVVTGTQDAINEPCETGRDCQINTRCDEVVTGASCAHSKCVPGVPLARGCDECVGRICDVDPSCCSGSGAWTWDCVDRVATVCDATCVVPGPYCAHNLCETGVAIQLGCHACADTICGNPSFAYCCDETSGPGWDQACMDEVFLQCGSAGLPPGPGETVCDYALLTKGSIAMYGGTIHGTVGGGTGANMISENAGMGARIYGDLYSSGSTFISGGSSRVEGDIWSAGAYTNSGATVTGRQPAAAGGDPIPSASIPTKTLTCPTGAADSNSASNRTLAPGSYGAVVQGGWGSTLTLQAGTYYMNSLEMQGGTTLAMPASGTVIINVCGNVIFRQQSRTSVLAGADVLNLQIYSHTGSITLEQMSVVYGVLSAPSGWPQGITMGQDARLFGAAWIGGVSSLSPSGALIDSTGFDRDDCLDAGLDPTAATCPVATPPMPSPTESGTCVSNQDGWTDATCSGFDLAIDFPCDDDLPVCNHGTVDFSGTVEVGYWDDTSYQMSDPSPDISALAGTCSQALTIPAGSCATMTCAVPAGTHTLMVDPNASLSECNANRLDNWSWDDGGTCSAPTGGVVAFEYEAVCPDGTVARWKTLTWDSETPAGSRIDFSMKVADSLGELTSESYTYVGTAQAGTPDTQICTLGGPAPECPVRITDQLSLGPQQGQFASVLAEPTGNPTLNDWTLRYTCVFDQ